MGNKKSPEELIREHEEHIRQIQLKSIYEKTDDYESLRTVHNQLKEVDDAELEARRGFSTKNPQNFEIRIKSHELWLNEILAQKELAEATLEYSNKVKPILQILKEEVALKINAGHSEEECLEFSQIQLNLRLSNYVDLVDNVVKAREKYHIAADERRKFVEEKKRAKFARN